MLSAYRYSTRMILIALVVLVFIGGFMLVPDPAPDTPGSIEDEAAVIEYYYEPLVAMTIGDHPVRASVADNATTRQRGLSDTPYLPEDIVKFFVFPEDNTWGIWMREMRYPIDIMWIDTDGAIVHIEHGVAPETYPETFRPDVPARYVIEAASGFVAEHEIEVGTSVDLPRR